MSVSCCGSKSNVASQPAVAAAPTGVPASSVSSYAADDAPSAGAAPSPISIGADATEAQFAAASLLEAGDAPSTYETSGFDEASAGAANVTGAAPTTNTIIDAQGTDSTQAYIAAAESSNTPAAVAATMGAQGAWDASWEQIFTDLRLAPTDMEFLRTSGFDAATLAEAARQLQQAPLIDSGALPTAGTPIASPGAVDSTSSSTVADGAQPEWNDQWETAWNPEWAARFTDVMTRAGATPDQITTELAAAASQPRTEAELQQIHARMSTAVKDVSDAPAPGTTVAPVGTGDWSPQWTQKFTTLMQKMGIGQQEIDNQLSAVEGTPMSEAQIQQAYDQMVQSLGAWDDTWKAKFQTLFDELQVPADQQSQAFAGLAGQGLDAAALQKAYDEMSATRPGWNQEWDDRFASLALGPELTKQIKESGAPAQALQEQFDKLITTKMEFSQDGRLKRLQDAGATADEQWSVMLSDMKPEDFDKTVEALHSQNVPLWKRGLSIAVNLIPGVGTVQYLLGQDFITGEKIDRTNPLNIGMAILSAIPVVTAVRGGMAALKGAGMLTTALKAGTAGTATIDALAGASMLTKFTQGLSIVDKIRVVTPILNRFGDGARMYQFGRGFLSATQATAAAAALRTMADGTKVVDKAMEASIFKSLASGSSIDDALAGAGRFSKVNSGTATFSTKSLVEMNQGTVFLQKAGAVHRFNPFSNKAGVEATLKSGSGGRLYTELVVGANFKPGSLAGIAQVRGSLAASNMSGMTMKHLAGVEATLKGAAAAGRPISEEIASTMISNARVADEAMGVLQANAIKMAGLNTTVIERIGLQGASVAEWGKRLGVGSGNRFRSLLQLSESSRAVKGLMSAATRTDNAWTSALRMAGGFASRNMLAPAAGMMTFGVLSGQTGKMVQPFWDLYKNKDKLEAEQKVRDDQAAAEQQQLEQQYREMQDRNAGTYDPNAPVTAPTPGVDAGSATGSGGGNGVYIDPATGWYVDEASGLMADPVTGNVVDPRTGEVVGTMGTPDPGTPAAQQAAAMQPAA